MTNDVTKNKYIPTEEDIKNIPKPSTDDSGVFFEVIGSPTPAEVLPANTGASAPSTTNSDLDTDYKYMRENLYTITEKSINALNNLAHIAEQSQHPRAYEVVATLVNTIASAQKDLMSIHKEKARIEGIVAKNNPEVVNNNLFVGNTAQLDEIIKKMTKKSNDE